MISFPVLAALRRKIIVPVDFYPTSCFRKPKYMRTEFIVKGEFIGWHLVNTETWQRKIVKTLSIEQKKLSPWRIWNDTLLIERLTENWSLENWV